MKKLLILGLISIIIISCSSPSVVKEEKKPVAMEENSEIYSQEKEVITVSDQAADISKPAEPEPSRQKQETENFVEAESIDDPYVEDGIDWSNRTITATGIGAPNPNAPNMAVKRAGAINAARIVALRDLLATIKGMYVSSEQTAENYMMTSDVVKTQVEGIAKAFRVVGEPKYFEDGSVEVTVEMSINGELSDLFLEQNEFGDTTPLVEEAKYKLSDLVPSEPEAYTGLVIDCRGLQLRPALSPRVFSRSGNEIYGTANVSKDFAVQQGMMGYLKDLESAKENVRVAKNPIVIKAAGVKGANKADIIISDADAEKIKNLNDSADFLTECRVVAIIN